MDASRAILIGTQYRLTQLVRSFRSANKKLYALYSGQPECGRNFI